ncbi:aldose 1-epimerase [Capnocytophaga sp. HP1101]
MISINKSLFGTYNGQAVYQYILKNANGFRVSVLNLGGTITEIAVKDKHNVSKNVVLGYTHLEDYIGNGAYNGATIGRTSGRIHNATFTIDGKTYHLFKNNGENSLHGGKEGFSSKIFDVTELPNGLEMRYTSPDGEEGYPATVDFKVIYTITEDNSLHIVYEAVADAKTYLNITNHSYFNLSGDMEANGDTQVLKIDADNICELAEGLIPTGKYIRVEGTTFDLRKGKVIAKGIAEGHPQFDITRAYDHPFVLNHSGLKGAPQLVLHSPESGITMEAYTTQRVAVIYTGNFLDDVPVFDKVCIPKEKPAKNPRFVGVAIEMQDFPDGINQRKFGVKPLEKGEVYRQETVYKFRS